MILAIFRLCLSEAPMAGKHGAYYKWQLLMIRYRPVILPPWWIGRIRRIQKAGCSCFTIRATPPKTWSLLQVAASNDTLQAGNPAPVVDRADSAYPKGRLFLFYNTGNASENMVRKGRGLREVWYKTSTDNGLTWSAPVNITLQVHKPRQPRVNSAYNFNEDWRSYANTPGHAIQLTSGKYKGRIYVAANHSAGEPQKHYADGRAFGYYTDDHGK